LLFRVMLFNYAMDVLRMVYVKLINGQNLTHISHHQQIKTLGITLLRPTIPLIHLLPQEALHVPHRKDATIHLVTCIVPTHLHPSRNKFLYDHPISIINHIIKEHIQQIFLANGVKRKKTLEIEYTKKSNIREIKDG